MAAAVRRNYRESPQEVLESVVGSLPPSIRDVDVPDFLVRAEHELLLTTGSDYYRELGADMLGFGRGPDVLARCISAAEGHRPSALYHGLSEAPSHWLGLEFGPDDRLCLADARELANTLNQDAILITIEPTKLAQIADQFLTNKTMVPAERLASYALLRDAIKGSESHTDALEAIEPAQTLVFVASQLFGTTDREQAAVIDVRFPASIVHTDQSKQELLSYAHDVATDGHLRAHAVLPAVFGALAEYATSNNHGLMKGEVGLTLKLMAVCHQHMWSFGMANGPRALIEASIAKAGVGSTGPT